jgi:OOP family OmpA-OmpF porin
MRLSLAPAMLAVFGAVAFAPAAAAGEYGSIAYLGLRGSFVITENGETKGLIYDYNQKYADGFGAALYMGWVLDENFRLEIEGGFRSADIDEVTIVRDDTLPPLPPALPPPPYTPGDVVDAGGDAQVGTAMVNLYYDIHLFDGPILPWIGVGVGGAFIDYAIDDPNSLITFNGKDTTWAFAYQFKAGVTFPVAEGISMSLGYTFFQTEDFTYENVFGEEQETDLTQHSVDLGMQFHL